MTYIFELNDFTIEMIKLIASMEKRGAGKELNID
jgi:hypothetical protein